MISDLYLGTSRRTRALQHSALVVIPPQPAMSLTRDLPIRSVGFPPTKAVHPPASQHGVFIPFAPFGFLIAEVFTTENTEHTEATDVPSNFWFELPLSFRDLCDLCDLCGKR